MQGLYRAFDECDASLAEINPLILTKEGQVMALDAKMNFDSNAFFRQKEIVALRDIDEEDPREVEASKYDLSYISLDGNIACMVNGAGLAMATMDIIKLYGGEPANFLDVGGGADKEKVANAFRILLADERVQGCADQYFWRHYALRRVGSGRRRCRSRVEHRKCRWSCACRGPMSSKGSKILADSGLTIITAETMAEAAEKDRQSSQMILDCRQGEEEMTSDFTYGTGRR